MNSKFFYECNDCGETFKSSQIIYLCHKCQKQNNPDSPPFGVLKTIYDYDEINSRLATDIFGKMKATGFIDLLPIRSSDSLSYLKVGNTPLYKITTFDNETLDFELYLKDESQNPTFSIKDRASQVVSAFAKEKNIHSLQAATNGNYGSSLAGICAAQKQKAVIIIPALVPVAKLTQIPMYGATVARIDGSYDDTYHLSVDASDKFGWYNCTSAFNPLTIEGYKIVSFELFSQLRNTIPDRIFVPVGDGVTISGIFKGFDDLLKLKIIDSMPVIIAVQSIGSSNIINNIDKNAFIYSIGRTIADAISVDIPKNFRMTKKFMNSYKGESIAVSDEEILAAARVLSSRMGLFAEPAASAAFAGFLAYYWDGKFEKGSRNVVLLTGSGLKDQGAFQKIIDMSALVKPEITVFPWK